MRERGRQKRHSLLAGLALFLFLCAPAAAATPDSFKTPEFRQSTGLDFMGAAEAYALGYTGAGVVLGIIDSPVRADHPELAEKLTQIFPKDLSTGLPYAPDYTQDTHGSHVGGIMAAQRDGLGMHGVAFDAGLASASTLSEKKGKKLDPPDVFSFFAARPDLRVINNSWGTDYYPFLEKDPITVTLERVKNDPVLFALAELARTCDKVVVFAAGNSGKAAPELEPSLPRYDPELTAWISVGSLDIRDIYKDADGKTVVRPGGVSVFSNLAKGAELWTIMSPGSQIWSLNAADRGYCFMSGTSMATPQVSGALGLVQQAFPWMTGKQMADAVLTTANNDFTRPEYVVLWEHKEDEGEDKDKDKEMKARVYFLDRDVPAGFDAADAKELISDTLVAEDVQYELQDMLDLVDAGDWIAERISSEEVFGQGLLDVGKAVRGIARLDANRMSAADVAALDDLAPGRRDALESFDTRGYVAEFSNDIEQRTWDDKYHHKDFQTSGTDPEQTKDATALVGLNAGLRKTGDGLLILSGDNSYAGATVIEGGALSVSRRSDGTGGVLQNSDVLVRAGGLLQGNGEIKKSVVNNGVVAPGNSIGVLAVGNYTQGAGGALRIEFDAAGNHDVLKVGTARLDGTLALVPQPDFYLAPVSVTPLDAASAPSGNFNAVRPALVSPTLDMRVTSLGNSYMLRPFRAADAYSRYADTAGAGSVGRAMPGVASKARGDMRALLTALDFSAPDGSGVRQGLSQLGPEAYDAAGRAALGQQKEFNILLLRRMLGNESRRRLDSRRTTRAAQETRATTVLAGPSAAAGAEPLSGWTAWISPFGSSAAQQDHGGTAGWASSGVGILGGMERRWDAGLTLGLHLALAGRRTDVNGPHDARAETRGAYIGAQALYGPDGWDGFYLTGQVRLGLEDNEMKRDVAFNGYARHNESRWTGLAGGALLGAGKDWTWGDYSAGPLAWLEYGFVQRPELSETDGQASRLHVDGGVYDSLLLSVGGHLGRAWALPKNAGLAVDLLAAWRHELLDGTFRSGASFRGYGNEGFTSATDLVGRDALLVQGSLRLTRGNNFFAQADLGGEFRTAASSVNAGLSFGWEF